MMTVMFDGKKLRALRIEKKLTQEQLAEFSGVSDRHIRSLENNCVNPSAHVLFRISRALGTPMDRLMTAYEEDEAHIH